MALPADRPFSFIVRVWRESREREPDAGEWRGSIEEVESGDRIYFTDLAAVAGFIKDRMDSIGINKEEAGTRPRTDGTSPHSSRRGKVPGRRSPRVRK